MKHSRSYLFVTWAGGGNVAPVLGVARRLVERGHEVSVLTEPCLRGAVDRAGARFVAFTRHFTRTDATVDLVRDWEARTPVGSLRRAFDNLIFGPARAVAEETRRVLREESPDVVVADLHMVGALVAAEAAGLPRVVLFHMPEHLPGPGRPAAGPGFLPRSDLPGRIRDGLLTRLFYRQLKRTLGPAMAEEVFDVPSNVRVVASASHDRVFPQADAVVTHAGHGTVMRALSHGLPLVCLPMGRDQNDNAAKVAAHGAGIRLRPSASPPRIRDAVRRVLNHDDYRRAAERLGGIIREDVAADRATLELEAVGQETRLAPAG